MNTIPNNLELLLVNGVNAGILGGTTIGGAGGVGILGGGISGANDLIAAANLGALHDVLASHDSSGGASAGPGTGGYRTQRKIP